MFIFDKKSAIVLSDKATTDFLENFSYFRDHWFEIIDLALWLFLQPLEKPICRFLVEESLAILRMKLIILTFENSW